MSGLDFINRLLHISQGKCHFTQDYRNKATLYRKKKIFRLDKNLNGNKLAIIRRQGC